MSSDDIKLILRKFYLVLRKQIHPYEITPIIDGLTEFDRQQIKATTRNDGEMLGNDKLLDTLGRRTTRTFVSFVTALRDDAEQWELAEQIVHYTKDYFPHIYNSIQNYKKVESPSVQTAAVKPVTHGQNRQISFQSHEQNRFNQRSNTVSQAVYTREQESVETVYISNHGTVQSVHRMMEVRQVMFTEDTLLEDIPNITFKKFAAELNKDNNWYKLGDVIQLTRKQIRELKNEINPGEEILDILCNNEKVTVRGLMHWLDSAGLVPVINVIKHSLGEQTVTTATTETQTSLPVSLSTNNSQEDLPSRDKKEETVEGRNNSSEDRKTPDDQVKKLNISSDELSTSSNSNDNPVEDSAVGAEGRNKTLINNLNRSEYKFEMVKEVHIHVNGDQNRTDVVNEDNQQNDDSTNNQRTQSPSINQSATSPEENLQDRSSPLMQTSHCRNTTEQPFDIQRGRSIDKISSLPGSLQLGVDQDQGQPSLNESSDTLQHIMDEPFNMENPGKNLEQECEALAEDLRNQPNLDSYRDLRTRNPGHIASDTTVITEENNTETFSLLDRIQQPESTVSRQENYGKNSEQEYQALNRDINNQ